AWVRAGRPSPVHVVELGPGRGTLMADFLRAGRVVPGFLDAAQVHLVESSPVLRRCQHQALTRLAEPVWHDDVGSLPDGPLLVVARGSVAAPPVRQFLRAPGGWRERMGGLSDGRLAFMLAPGATPAALLTAGDGRLGEGAVREVSSAALSIMSDLARR